MSKVSVSIKAGLVALCLAVGGGVASSVGHAADAIKGNGGKIRLLFGPSGTNSFPPFVMQKFGLDKKYGFVLEPIPSVTTQTTITGLQGKNAEIGILDWITIGRLQNSGVGVVAIAPFLIWANTVVVSETSPYKTIADLKGKKIGVYGRSNLDWIVMRAVGQSVYKMDIERETTVHEGAVPLLRGLMDQGQVDAVQMYNSITPAMVAGGKYRVLVTIRNLIKSMNLPDTPFLMYTIDSEYAKANPQNVKAFLAAYREAIDILNKDDAVWVERGKQMELEGEALRLFRDEAREDMMDKFAPNTESDVRKVFDVLLATGGVSEVGIGALPQGFMTLQYQ